MKLGLRPEFNLESAAVCLNEKKHNGYADWKVLEDETVNDGKYLNAGNGSYDGNAFLTEFEALAVATAYFKQ